MVRGIETFREHFAGLTDRYVIIGGTACDLSLTAVGVEFRATKDIDIVLNLEAMDVAFVEAFWSFVKQGRYESQETSGGERKFYRFKKPKADTYPYMLELFSRVPDLLGTGIAGHLTPIPVDDEISSLSAILLDSDYYAWTHAGKIEIGGLPVVRSEHLIPLKAKAWLDLTDRSAAGQRVDSRDIRKHKNDVFRLYAITDPEYRPVPAESIRSDMRQFIQRMRGETIELRNFGLSKVSLASVLDTLDQRYAVQEEPRE